MTRNTSIPPFSSEDKAFISENFCRPISSDEPPQEETTFVMIKPDGMKNPEFIAAVERLFKENNFDILASEEINLTQEQAAQHMTTDSSFCTIAGENTLGFIQHYKINTQATIFDTRDPVEMGKICLRITIDYLTSGPVKAMAVKGPNAISRIKLACGKTFPELADPYSLRGRFGTDTIAQCFQENRAIHNMIHAADSVQEANTQLRLFFPQVEINRP